ncbi:MAG: TetR/AcrR family transcriptional regulator [Pseudomonadales bacterium]|nr:TetR/AcrR family transcriptional regulator [Pseudomonadales bacterium]MBL6815160.1 TetR/AcrR family transcriptional regulator [Pseudomonadales bacterium]
MAVDQGLQQLKSARARDNMCKATIQLLAELGYAETTIAGVAQNAGFSKGAVQYHFPTKEELIAATVEHLLMRTVSSASQSYESVDSALLNAWQRLVNTSAYRALLEVLNAARIDRKLRLRISAELVAWGKNLDQQSLTIYQSANEQLPAHEGDAEVVMLLNMTRSFMRGLLTQEQYGVSPEETLTYVAKWIELIAPMLKLRSTRTSDGDKATTTKNNSRKEQH